MSQKDRCREVSRLLQTMPKGGCEETLRMVCDHLSECEACRALYADLQEMDELLVESREWFDGVARQSRIDGRRIIDRQLAPLARRRAWRLRAAWAGAALLLVIAGAAVFFPFHRGGHAPPTVRPPVTQTTTVTQALAAECSSRTLLAVAEVVRRREAPSLRLPHKPRPLPRESFFPRSLQRCDLESDTRIARIVRTKIDLSTPSVTPRRSLVPPFRQQSTLESHDTLGRILRSRINLTRRQDT